MAYVTQEVYNRTQKGLRDLRDDSTPAGLAFSDLMTEYSTLNDPVDPPLSLEDLYERDREYLQSVIVGDLMKYCWDELFSMFADTNVEDTDMDDLPSRKRVKIESDDEDCLHRQRMDQLSSCSDIYFAEIEK